LAEKDGRQGSLTFFRSSYSDFLSTPRALSSGYYPVHTYRSTQIV
jgi:hypothetical protein